MKKLFVFCFLATILFACGQGKNPNQSADGEKGGALDGAAIFKKNCVLCHGAKGNLQMNGAKDLSLSELDLKERIYLISNGKNTMTPFKEMLSPEEIEAVANYTFSFKK